MGIMQSENWRLLRIWLCASSPIIAYTFILILIVTCWERQKTQSSCSLCKSEGQTVVIIVAVVVTGALTSSKQITVDTYMYTCVSYVVHQEKVSDSISNLQHHNIHHANIAQMLAGFTTLIYKCSFSVDHGIGNFKTVHLSSGPRFLFLPASFRFRIYLTHKNTISLDTAISNSKT